MTFLPKKPFQTEDSEGLSLIITILIHVTIVTIVTIVTAGTTDEVALNGAGLLDECFGTWAEKFRAVLATVQQCAGYQLSHLTSVFVILCDLVSENVLNDLQFNVNSKM